MRKNGAWLREMGRCIYSDEAVFRGSEGGDGDGCGEVLCYFLAFLVSLPSYLTLSLHPFLPSLPAHPPCLPSALPLWGGGGAGRRAMVDKVQ